MTSGGAREPDRVALLSGIRCDKCGLVIDGALVSSTVTLLGGQPGQRVVVYSQRAVDRHEAVCSGEFDD